MGKIQAISVSDRKGVIKENVPSAYFENDFGIKGDAHAGKWHRQVSLLALESVKKMQEKGLDVKSGDFAENITTEGIDLLSLPVGTKIKIKDVEFIISQIGKICHHKCAVYYHAGECVMPKEGIFAVVRGNGELHVGDEIQNLGKDGFSVGIITLSDRASKGEYEDLTGPALEKYVSENLKTSFIRKEIIPDDTKKLELTLKDFADTQMLDLIITNGSTGISPRDIAPDITMEVIEKRLPGFEEAMRAESFKITATAIVSRAVCGTRKNSLIINLPGSPKGAVENLSVIMPAIEHTIKKLQGDKSDCAAR
ncbi:MAG: molybdopterin-binding protein [Mucispirillum sp.]|uniref:Molybdenum cofactor biosynthesis protein n=1 Tax=Candidatus Mucispirillum faecigallinarum TaxID=2838699 RepID=A0A9D2GTN7_9BACT|nr:molybdopterin-binding protein [Mucispirillum sp.]HIZ88830.1 molybdenum cofactor biosynthesis protein [Candidatus Mucispirillum faecigallinarum]